MNINSEKEIPGFEGRYVVGARGYVRKIGRRKRNYGTMNNRNDLVVHIIDNSGKDRMFSISRLVAEAFLDNPGGKTQVDHIDTNRRNNRVDNLRWATPRENMANFLTSVHRREPKLFRRPNKGLHPMKADLGDGRVIHANTMTDMARKLGCSTNSVARCYYGEQEKIFGRVRISPVRQCRQLDLF